MIDENIDWQPTASINHLRLRAKLIATIRHFFTERDVLEVDTPLLCRSTATDPHIHSLTTSDIPLPYYLQTSPEFAMKRLLAAGSGSIYQLAKAFRRDEQGRHHNVEFTLLEWYRVGFDHQQLMDEVDALLQAVLKTDSADRCTYAELFQQYLQLDPHQSTALQLQQCAQAQGISGFIPDDADDKDSWLHLLLSHCIEPHVGQDKPLFITDFPASQAALAKIRAGDPPVAERFELYYRGVELANGYHELTHTSEQQRRFMADNRQRQARQLPQIPIDERLLAALQHGMPECAGVALGIDRLMMLAAGANAISEVISFTAERV